MRYVAVPELVVPELVVPELVVPVSLCLGASVYYVLLRSLYILTGHNSALKNLIDFSTRENWLDL